MTLLDWQLPELPSARPFMNCGSLPRFRGPDGERALLLLQGGGTAASEAAVAAALKWLAEHQLQDGSWTFRHRQGPCQGRCTNQGDMDDGHFAATGLALQCFLGSGNTHLKGQYKKNVRAGLLYLTENMSKENGEMIDGGKMYSHGLATIALCEAYGMTTDKATIGRAALAACDFISYAQDPVGGGWRYQPRTPGDMSVSGVQAMALFSAKRAYLRVDPKTFAGFTNFLNSVQSDGGAKFGYMAPDDSPATTAIGLLCRMYLGVKRDNEALVNGMAYLSDLGPSDDDMYYNHYATQVLCHYGGDKWTKWNDKLREHLIAAQAQAGHERGSWHFRGGDGITEGGRHLNTCLAALTLEVYYRHPRIFIPPPVVEEFDF